jgi:hypothetical protein
MAVRPTHRGREPYDGAGRWSWSRIGSWSRNRSRRWRGSGRGCRRRRRCRGRGRGRCRFGCGRGRRGGYRRRRRSRGRRRCGRRCARCRRRIAAASRHDQRQGQRDEGAQFEDLREGSVLSHATSFARACKFLDERVDVWNHTRRHPPTVAAPLQPGRGPCIQESAAGRNRRTTGGRRAGTREQSHDARQRRRLTMRGAGRTLAVAATRISVVGGTGAIGE